MSDSLAIVTDCPCGVAHLATMSSLEAFWNVTDGAAATVRVEVLGGGAWLVPRLFIAFHGLKAAELPALAERYGFEPDAEPG